MYELDGYNWSELIIDLMKKYDNLYTDISYSLADFKNETINKRVLNWLNTKDDLDKELGHRVLFGTDFYMTEQETKEAELYNIARETLGKWYPVLTKENSLKFIY